MTMPEGFGSKGEHRLTQALLKSGFHQNRHDYSLFTKATNGKFVLILVYVDDLLITDQERKYALEMISEAGLSGSKPNKTPMEQNLKLTSIEFDEIVKENTDDNVLEDRRLFQRLVGKLLYLTITRPDIASAVQSLTQFMHAPKKSLYEVALHVVRYIKDQPGLGLLMSNNIVERV
ncbi:uncharacterized mitochondrial protein AtMg00810-like [Nicotiana sylvestris]|uniref:uncharacterized mitochondrial protein AtMg00810-like n=1 Tax=Nicotiana sylvestris TaxID=4096 RepID=UPI00388CEB32